jgi:chromosome segregation ATPase
MLQKSETLVSINKTAALAALNKSFAEMNLTQCQKAAEFLQASSRVKSRVTSIVSKDDCDRQRQMLQDEFANSFIQITQLRDSTAQRIADAHEDCIALADGVKSEAHERLDSSITESTSSINRAQEILNALNPLLLDAKKGLKKVQDHMKELEDSCAKEDDVSEHLQRVRDLIMSLEKCPGRHDYQLQMPASAVVEAE